MKNYSEKRERRERRTVRAPHSLDIRKASALEVEGGLRVSEFGVTRQTQKDDKSTRDISREYEYQRRKTEELKSDTSI